jgi:hypothetical protein
MWPETNSPKSRSKRKVFHDDLLKVAATLACSNKQSLLLGTPPLKLYYINILHKIEHVKETG